MAKTNLTDEEKEKIIEALNNSAEPPPELMTKLFPGLAEKFDVAKLDRAKIVTLEYAGKRSEAAILNQSSPTDAGSPLQVESCFRGGSLTHETQLDLFEKAKNDPDDGWQNLIVQGDNLQFLKTCYQNADPLIKDKLMGKVKLIYIDPPFATKREFRGSGDEKSYSDKVESAEFIEGLRERLIYMRELLADDGCIYVHLDQKMSHYIKVIMDDVFGKEQFLNEIIWYYQSGGIAKNFFPRKHEVLLLYSANLKLRLDGIGTQRNKCESCGQVLEKWNNLKKEIDEDGRIYRTIKSAGKIYKYYDDDIVPPTDVWLGINHLQQKDPERVGFPTQKPERLLERVISASTGPNELIMDAFSGSGTTAAVAEKLGRRWIMCDFSKHAIYTMQKRMLGIGESKALGKGVKQNQKYGKPPKPFCVISTGAYDFSRIMKLRENKDAYIDFVLGLFQVTRDEKGLSSKYRLTNIYGEKDSDPVEVYPVWDDEYLKNIRINEQYLKGIIVQSGGRLKGTYYIITPETCALIGDTIMKNTTGDEVHFKLLKFPYKILEDVSRSFQIHEQPSSQENVNELINSTGFYFNDNVEIEVEKTKEGLTITRFDTRILDKYGDRLKGFGGLAMLLVDADYNGEIFDMDRTIFANEISEAGEIKVAGLTGSVAVIAIDKHGNESKPFIIKD
jgi:DNA modification methylase